MPLGVLAGKQNHVAHLTSATGGPRQGTPAVPQPGPEGVNVYLYHSSEPAPMGIADYGVSKSGPYSYSTNASLGKITIASLSARNSTGDTWMSFQLNVVLGFSDNGVGYVYWIQDVAQIDTSSNTIYFLDNIWNASSLSAGMSGSAISGNGQISSDNGTEFYLDSASDFMAGNGIILTYPATVSFLVSTTVNSLGQPSVTFEYDDGSGLQTYDSVTFVSVGHLTSFSGFEVNGYVYNPLGIFYDSELILGGVCCGYQTLDVQSDVSLQLSYWNGHNYQMVTNAYNFGSDTAEGIQNVLSEWYYYPSTGQNIAEVTAGAGTLGELYDQSQVGIIDVRSSLNSGDLYVVNSTDSLATPWQIAFVDKDVTVTVYPGSYFLQLYQSGVLIDQGTFNVSPGQRLSLQSPFGGIAVTFSYSIVGGGSGYSPPILTYISNGVQQEAVLGTAPAVYRLDSGSTWSVTTTLPGSTTSERWDTSNQTSGIATSTKTVVLVYNHQYTVTFAVSPLGAGRTSPSGSGQWENAGPLPLSATRNLNYVFSSWSSSTGAITFANPKSASTTATISGAGTITANFVVQVIVSERVSIVMSPEGSPSVTVAVLGCDANVASVAADGDPHAFTADSQCSLTFTAPTRTSLLVWEFSNSGTGSTSWTYTTGDSGIDVKTNTLYSLDRDTVAYSIVGNGSGYSAPILSFQALGLPRTYTMTAIVTEVDADNGSSWRVTNPLLGSGSDERWQAPDSIITGTSFGGATIAPVYYNQFLDILSYSVVGGGSPTAPTVTANQFGSVLGQVLTTSPTGYWFDAGASWAVTNLLNSSGSSQKWQTDQVVDGTLSSVAQTTLAFTYCHQFLVTLSYSIIAGGSPTAPARNGTAFGRTSSGTLSSSPTTFWLDAGSDLNLPRSLFPSNDSERWVTNLTLPLAVNSAITKTVGYQHQYYVNVEGAKTGGGSVSPASQWCNAMSSLHLVASPTSGWSLGTWVGIGSGSYSGNATITDTEVKGPINETAVFYPGLNLDVESGGSATYSYGSTLGHASPGQHVLYVPPGTNVTLIANPSSVFYSFGGWVITHASGMSTIWIVVDVPTTTEATFSYDLVVIGTLFGATVVIVAIVVFYTLRIRGRRNPPQLVPSGLQPQTSRGIRVCWSI